MKVKVIKKHRFFDGVKRCVNDVFELSEDKAKFCIANGFIVEHTEEEEEKPKAKTKKAK